MKKLLSLLLITAVVVSMYGCGSNSADAPDSKVASDEDLAQAVALIKEAEDAVESAASHQLDGWTKYSSIMLYYFDDDSYADAGDGEIKNRAIKLTELRAEAREALEEAKNLIGTNGSGDYYDAVKEYYKAVNVFLSLVSEFPDGYSKLTFSTTVSEYKTNCETAYAELEFYN